METNNQSLQETQGDSAWVEHYNHDRPHQGIGMVAPWERFRLADTVAVEPVITQVVEEDLEAVMPAAATRKVDRKGTISFASVRYKAGVWLAGETVQVVCDGGLVQLHRRGVVIATHARRHDLAKQNAGLHRRARGTTTQSRPTASAVSVTRKVDSSGNVSFAGSHYRAGNAYRRRQVQVAVVGDHVELSIGEELIRRHRSVTTAPASTAHWPTPGGRPRRINAA